MGNGVLAYAEAVDVISALELKYNQVEEDEYKRGAYDLENIIPLVNMGCIKESDNVLILASKIEEITGAISYLYAPNQLMATKIDLENSDEEWRLTVESNWKDIRELLDYYAYTEPTFFQLTKIDSKHKSNKFDIVIGGYCEEELEGREYGRFDFDGGTACDIFLRILINSHEVLNNEGRLIVLARPSWILKSWELLHKLGLQLEYQQYHLYSNDKREPNALVWLRFIKAAEGFDVEKQKRNLLALMEANNIDRLYAHRNNLIFPYVELSYKNAEVYVQVEQNLEYLQYFFSAETTKSLADLCEGYTACLVTPSIAVRAYNDNKNVVLFERDNRFREKKGLKFVKYDLEKGLTEFTKRKYCKKFERVICDPPFDISLDVLARDIEELLKTHKDSIAYVVFPDKRKVSLVNAMKAKGLSLVEEQGKINIEYGRPPKLVRMYGKQAIQIYKFLYDSVK